MGHHDKTHWKYLDEMKAAGVQVERYHPLNWYTLARINNRTHRKLLVVDGRIGFTGGVGIADPWTGNAGAADHWRDSHYQPDELAIQTFISARKRGVKVEIIVPGPHTDSQIVASASRAL